MATGGSDELSGRTWSWRGTAYGGNRATAPDAPERYTLEFVADGRVNVRADCNRGGARYETGASGALSLTPVAVTKMGCPPGSKDTEFLRQLGDTAGYRFVDGDLVLTLKSDEGAMRFTPLAR
jgi:heat shock protein HslJ